MKANRNRDKEAADKERKEGREKERKKDTES